MRGFPHRRGATAQPTHRPQQTSTSTSDEGRGRDSRCPRAAAPRGREREIVISEDRVEQARGVLHAVLRGPSPRDPGRAPLLRHQRVAGSGRHCLHRGNHGHGTRPVRHLHRGGRSWPPRCAAPEESATSTGLWPETCWPSRSKTPNRPRHGRGSSAGSSRHCATAWRGGRSPIPCSRCRWSSSVSGSRSACGSTPSSVSPSRSWDRGTAGPRSSGSSSTCSIRDSSRSGPTGSSTPLHLPHRRPAVLRRSLDHAGRGLGRSQALRASSSPRPHDHAAALARAGRPKRSMPPPPRCAASNATCTTGPRHSSWPSPCGSGRPRRSWPATVSSTSTPCAGWSARPTRAPRT